MKVAGKDFKGYEYADGTHWATGEKRKLPSSRTIQRKLSGAAENPVCLMML